MLSVFALFFRKITILSQVTLKRVADEAKLVFFIFELNMVKENPPPCRLGEANDLGAWLG